MSADDEREQLRELVREAHGAIRDLDRLLAEYRRVARDTAHDAQTRVFAAANAELGRFSAHLQREANALAKQLNTAILAAQRNITDSLAISEVFETADGKLGIKFAGGLFDDQVPVDDDPAGS